MLAMALIPLSCNAQKSSSMQRINKLIEAGDTVAQGGYIPYVIIGANVTPEMFDNNRDIIRPEQISASPLPDSDLCVVMRHNGDIFTCQKYFIPRLFPKATDFVVDGDKVSKAEFYRIPASLLLSVTAEKNGKKLVAKTRDANAPNPLYKSMIDAENEWYLQHKN